MANVTDRGDFLYRDLLFRSFRCKAALFGRALSKSMPFNWMLVSRMLFNHMIFNHMLFNHMLFIESFLIDDTDICGKFTDVSCRSL